jgi:hypothetical protein
VPPNSANRPSLQSQEAYKLISSLNNLAKKNLLRGYSSKSELTSTEIKAIRIKNSPRDLPIIGAILNGPNGLRGRTKVKIKRTSTDLFKLNSIPELGWREELLFTVGYLNSVTDECLRIIDVMSELVDIASSSPLVSLTCILEASRKYGASNYLSYKLAYIRSAHELASESLSIVSKIEEEFDHKNSVGMHYSALENINPKISLFGVARRKITGMIGKVDGDFRKSLSLSNFIPTPIDTDDVAGFLLRATESSLIDAIYSIIILLNLGIEFNIIQKELNLNLNTEILLGLQGLIDNCRGIQQYSPVTNHYRVQNELNDESMNLYRLSSAFMERPELAQLRNIFDRTIGVRLISELTLNRKPEKLNIKIGKEQLLSKSASVMVGKFQMETDIFLRTFLFLNFIADKSNILNLSKDEIKFIFENTEGLDVLLREDEIRTLYITASSTTKSLVAVLALALFRKKSIDPDIDFEFRSDFIEHVKSRHNSSVMEFITSLLQDSPQIANYLVVSLDVTTLEKMYSLIANASAASKTRGEILRAIGQRLNRIEYIIEADAIITRSKLSKLQHYFDSSRMYVDSIEMKKWLDTNPSISTEQYRALSSRIDALISSSDNLDAKKANQLLIDLNGEDEFIIFQIVKEAFEQFCLNTEFGIESYLGRRIRHNTLDGVTSDTVDAVLRKPEYAVLRASRSMQRVIDLWLESYKSIIDKLRRDQLQFKNGGTLFNPSLDLSDPYTRENIRKLSNTLSTTSGTEILNELVVAFCWRQITPQLDHAARYIRTTLLKEAYGTIDKSFSGFHGPVEAQLKAELHEAVNEVFKKVADWFQVPETGFVSASVRELCQIISGELSRNNSINFAGNAVDSKYTGISVHRIYDCLAVLLKNAQNHGKDDCQIRVEVNSRRASENSLLDYISIGITSSVDERDFMEAEERILSAINTKERGRDMVTEGYTGIQKIKVITRASEGMHTVKCVSDAETNELELTFSMHAEIAHDVSVAGKES